MAKLMNPSGINNGEIPDYKKAIIEDPVFQIEMYGKYTGDKRYSNAIYYQDQMPWFAYGKNITKTAMTSAKDAKIVNSTEIRGKTYVVTVEPAMFSDDETDEVFWRYPAKREEMVLEALKKIATIRSSAYVHDGSIGVFFTLSQVQRILGRRFNCNEIKQALEVMISAKVTINEVGEKDPQKISHMLTDLYLNSHSDWERNTDCKCFVKFHTLITNGIKDGLYRKIDLEKMIKFKASLSSVIYKRLVLMFTQADVIDETYTIRSARLLKESGFSDKVGPYLHKGFDKEGKPKEVIKTRYFRDIIKPLTRALKELQDNDIIQKYEEVKTYKEFLGGKKEMQTDSKIVIYPAQEFVNEQIAANAEVNNIRFLTQVASEDPLQKIKIDNMEPADFSVYRDLSSESVEQLKASKKAMSKSTNKSAEYLETDQAMKAYQSYESNEATG